MKLSAAHAKIFSATALLFISGCLGTGVETPESKEAKEKFGPQVVTLTPASGPVGSIPTSVTVGFSEAVNPDDVVEALFDVTTSTCATPPTVGTPVMNSTNTGATASLSGASCSAGETTVVRVDPSLVRDVIGNFGLGTVSRTYTFTDGPVIAFGAPSLTEVSAASAAASFLTTFTDNVTTPAINTTSIGQEITGTASCGSITGSVISAAGGTINVFNCTGDGTVAIHMNAGFLFTDDDIPNVESADSTAITVDNTGPTITGITPNATINAVSDISPLVATFSDNMLTTSITAGDFALSGCVLGGAVPTPQAPTFNGPTNTQASSILAGGTCIDGDVLTLTFNAAGVQDSVGNAGTGGNTIRTYTFDTVGPTIAFGAPAGGPVNSASPAVTIAATFNNAVGGDVSGFDGTDVTLVSSNPPGGATCGTVTATGVTTAGATINLSNCSGDGDVAVQINAGSILDSVGNPNLVSGNSATFRVDNIGPTVTVSGVTATTATATFSEPVDPMTVALTDFVVSGCFFDPVPENLVNVGGTNTVFTVDLNQSGATCNPGDLLMVTVNAAGVNDLSGLMGTNSDNDTFLFP